MSKPPTPPDQSMSEEHAALVFGGVSRVPIVLDDASLAAFEAEPANPSEPTEALRALFRKR